MYSKQWETLKQHLKKMYQITLNEAMILCALKEASDKVTATNLSKQTELSPHTHPKCCGYWKKKD